MIRKDRFKSQKHLFVIYRINKRKKVLVKFLIKTKITDFLLLKMKIEKTN